MQHPKLGQWKVHIMCVQVQTDTDMGNVCLCVQHRRYPLLRVVTFTEVQVACSEKYTNMAVVFNVFRKHSRCQHCCSNAWLHTFWLHTNLIYFFPAAYASLYIYLHQGRNIKLCFMSCLVPPSANTTCRS